MTLHKLSAGSGYTYLTKQVAAEDASDRRYANLGTYYSERGESPGRWLGRGLAGLGPGDPVAGERVVEAQMVALFGHGQSPNAPAGSAPRLGAAFSVAGPSAFRVALAERIAETNRGQGRPATTRIDDDERARLRTELGREWFAGEHGREPVDARELSEFLTAASRPGRTSTAGYDLTFSPVKSVSTLWALTNPETAAQIEAAHRAAVEDVVGWLEQTAVFTRLGASGARQVDVSGLIAVAFTHRESRAGDPDLHTHVAISNKVQTADGRWRALDGRVLYAAAVSASERYNTRLEAQLSARLGLRFADRSGPTGKQPVREVVGVNTALMRQWSARRAAIAGKQTELAAEFAARYGRQPHSSETYRLNGQATTETRARKHRPTSEAELREMWRAEAVTRLGSEDALTAMFGEVAAACTNPATAAPPVGSTAREVVEAVAGKRATWQAHHIRAEVERRARAVGIAAPAVDGWVEATVAGAIECSMRLGDPDEIAEPTALRRRDGTSQFTVAGTQLFTSTPILEAEARLLDAATALDGRTVDGPLVELALLEARAAGLELNDGQQELVRSLATSGARVQLALAPAGTGKTTALGVLARAWTEDGGQLVGVAPSAAAAAQLREALGAPTDTVAKLLHAADPGTPGAVPDWVRDIGPSTLVVLDEAGMVGTPDLDRLVAFALGRGASVRLVGDDRQLTARQSGGVLRDIAETAGVVTLDAVVRFADPDEGFASLGLRRGEPDALAFYLERDRVHGGDGVSAVEQAYASWVADRDEGRDSVLLAATNETVRSLNLRARSDRLRTEGPPGREAALHDGTTASAGDTVVSRRNERRLPISSTDWVKNGDRWLVEHVTTAGDLRVVHLATRRVVTLPAAYVADHVDLGYATTIHLAQGRTADTAYTVLTGRESRESLYVAMTRGRVGNHVYLEAATEPEAGTHPDAIAPPTTVERLERVLARSDARPSATTQRQHDTDPAVRLRAAVSRYVEAVSVAPAGPGPGVGPLPWLPPVPVVGDEWSAYLQQRSDLVVDLSSRVADALPTAGWSERLREADPGLAWEVSVWRTANEVPMTERHVCAAEPEGYAEELTERVAAVAGDVRTAIERWHPLVASIEPRFTTDTWWPILADALDRAAACGYDANSRLGPLIAKLPANAISLSVANSLGEDCPELARLARVSRPAPLNGGADHAAERHRTLDYVPPLTVPSRGGPRR